jgi:Na+/H+ antiporter NhaD/arsenite permease-like protein
VDRRPTIAGPTPLLNPTSTVTTLIPAIFAIGFLAIMLEHPLRVNKAAAALLTAALCWTAYALSGTAGPDIVSHALTEHMGDIASILFFLLGAMTIVELIDAHDGFDAILSLVRTRHRRRLLWIVGGITFFLSAVLDNLTTTIVMVSMIRRLMRDERDRMVYAGLVVIAANAGGAWSPIGDVTTTMLWIGGQISATGIMRNTFLPSLLCTVLPILLLMPRLRGEVASPEADGDGRRAGRDRREGATVLLAGVLCLLSVPLFKMYTHLPPFMGMLAGLGVMWVFTGWIHKGKNEADKDRYSVNFALRKIDTPSILFFLGILASVAALESTGLLHEASAALDRHIGDERAVVVVMGLLSAVIDNVPLVAAAQGMYTLSSYPTDHPFWELMAFATGTGGSCLIIGSAAGVAAMGMLRIEFFWYLRRIAPLALAGYLGGALLYLLLSSPWPA